MLSHTIGVIDMDRTQRKPLVYSEKFRNAVLTEYPDNNIIKDLLDKNDYFLGRLLDDGTYSSIPYDVIIRMLENGEANQLLEKARHIKNLVDLYHMWDKEVFLD